MIAHRLRPLAAAIAFSLSLLPLAAAAAGVSVKSDLSDPAASPFPSDRFTVRDWTNNTLRRVNLPTPDCAVRVSDCADIAVINTLDGFSTQPRITVPFTGDIDPASVSSSTVFLINLGDTLSSLGFGHKVGINQIVWDPATKTLAFESDELLAEHSRYLLVVTDGVRDSSGQPIRQAHIEDDPSDDLNRGQEVSAYRHDLRDAARLYGGPNRIAATALFTTQSISADLAKIQRQIAASTPAPLDFMVGSAAGAPVRAVFDPATLTAIQFVRQTGTAPTFTTGFVPTTALGTAPGAVGRVAYARFQSADYETADKFIPATGTLTGQPQPQGSNALMVQLFIPAGPAPAGGWPVAIFGHGFGDSMYGAPWIVAATLASKGLASANITVVGHGGGPLGTLNVLRPGAVPVVIDAGGRGIDQNGDGKIDSTEGSSSTVPLVSSRDGLRQTVADIMQLVREIQVGVDVDGDGQPDLNPQRIYYAGQSFGGIYGTILLGVEPNIAAGVPNVPGGSIIEIVRLSPVFRGLLGFALATRVPSLINIGGLDFNENMPLRNQPTVINNVAGAMEISKVIDRSEWVQQAGNPAAYAPFIRKQPLAGNAAKPVIFQFAKGDMTVPNPTTTAILRAGDLADRATYYRNDLAFQAVPSTPKNPHTFLTNVFVQVPSVQLTAIQAQTQMALFLASHGTLTIDPDGPGPLFETPTAGPLPEVLNFIP
jgi:hypothetical protein